MTVLIGLHGRKGSGKDTAYSFIHKWADERGVLAVRRGFADKLKHSFARLFTPDCTLVEGVDWCNQIKDTGVVSVEQVQVLSGGQTQTLKQEILGRTLLQRYGTESHRDVFGPDFWVDALLPLPESEVPAKEEASEIFLPDWRVNFIPELDPFSDDAQVFKLPELAVITDVRFPNEAQRIQLLGGEIWLIDRPSTDIGDTHSSEQLLSSKWLETALYSCDLEQLELNVRSEMNKRYSNLGKEPVE